ncbi:hypothetical protein E2C01_048951 [Portunus trituberculatus]|uniref:Uncharacterized protein n=1 Tax=Portunus trituberculatus TaxID=210409 RepID=A0A5B7G4D5_PORTR|nr:hypothetical protein [Portunus trituberculatus]
MQQCPQNDPRHARLAVVGGAWLGPSAHYGSLPFSPSPPASTSCSLSHPAPLSSSTLTSSRC